MIFLYFIELIIILLFLLIMGTQVMYPLIMGRTLFPLLRERKLESKLADLNEEIHIEQLKAQVKERGKELFNRRQGDTDKGQSK